MLFRPTGGGRILRCFSNINPTNPRVWCTTDGFTTLARTHAKAAGLDRIAEGGVSAGARLLETFQKAFGMKVKSSTPYDKFMLRFHDYLKENSAFQQECPKIRMEFQPGATWICFTDSVPHSVLHGQYALEQTVIVPISAMVTPEKSPLRVLESLAGRSLSNGMAMAAQAAAGAKGLVERTRVA